jgi:hypothetical protein
VKGNLREPLITFPQLTSIAVDLNHVTEEAMAVEITQVAVTGKKTLTAAETKRKDLLKNGMTVGQTDSHPDQCHATAEILVVKNRITRVTNAMIDVMTDEMMVAFPGEAGEAETKGTAGIEGKEIPLPLEGTGIPPPLTIKGGVAREMRKTTAKSRTEANTDQPGCPRLMTAKPIQTEPSILRSKKRRTDSKIQKTS